MSSLLETIGGALLMALALLDVFVTVLYARAGTGLFSRYVITGAWLLFRRLARLFGSRAGVALSMCGPSIVLLMIFLWALLLAVSAALVFHPYLGSSITAGNGPTPTDFVSALFAAGSSMSIVGSSDFSPRTSVFRLLYLFNSLAGMSVISVTLTYLLQIYNALQQRNVVGLQFHLLSGLTDDSAELLMRVAPQGRFEAAQSTLSSLGSELADLKEKHHFYPVLLYFRFPDAHYAVSYTAGMAFDCASLIDSAIDREAYSWLQDFAAVTQLWDASLLLLEAVDRTFGGSQRGHEVAPTEADRQEWGRRCRAVLERFQTAGIRVPSDRAAGEERYKQLRAEWDGRVQSVARAMLYRPEEVDAAHAKARGYPPRLSGRLRNAN